MQDTVESTTGGWTAARLAGAAALAALAVVALRGAWLDIARIGWVDEESNQVLLAVPVIVWLLAMRRGTIVKERPVSSILGSGVVVLGIVMALYGYTQATQVLWHAGAVAMLLGAVWSVLGNRVVLAALPILGAMLFLIPVPAAIRLEFARPLQEITAQAAQVVLTALGQNADRAGMMVYIDGEQAVRIDEACNGMRMLFSLLLVCYAYAMVTPLRPWVRVLIVVLSPLMALGANIMRVVPTALVYAKSESQDLGDFFHSMDGWLMTILAFLVLMGIVRLLEWAQLPVRPEKPGPAARPAGGGA